MSSDPRTIAFLRTGYQTILKSAFGYGGYNLGVYGIELPMIDPWTSRPAVIDIVLNLFEVTTKFIDSPTSRTDPTGSNKKEADEQLPELASVIFACIQERLAWLGRWNIFPWKCGLASHTLPQRLGRRRTRHGT
jgi:hypothetical protein